ncbi:MAG: zinc ribbon domain-containing protein [Candidatus Dormibacterales bacterium]
MTKAFCVNCGAELGEDHRHCPRCGTARWVPPQTTPELRPPPGPGTQSFHPVVARPVQSPRLRLLPYIFAMGAVFWLIELAQFAAVVAAPAGRDQMQQALVNAGITQDVTTVVVFESVIGLALTAAAAALHSAAYFGLRRVRPWGWITAVIVATAWSLVLVGIPILVLLMRRDTRAAYGIS